MANKSYWDQDLEEFNPYYAQFYNKDGTAKTSQNNDNAKDTLRDSENSALSGEKSFFTGSGKNKKGGKSLASKNPLKAKGKKKIGATIVVTLIMTISGLFIGSSTSLLVPALENLLTEATDVQYASNTKRSAQLVKFMLQGDEVVSTTWTGSKKYTSMTGFMKKRLKAQGIEVEGIGKKRVLKFNNKTITADDFVSQFKTNQEFQDAFMKAKRGRIMGFFDNVANKIYAKLSQTRNIFKNFKQSGNAEDDADTFHKTMSNQFSGDTTEIVEDIKEERTATDENGNAITDSDGNKVPAKDADGKVIVDQNKQTTLEGNSKGTNIAEAETKAKSYLEGISGKLKAGVTGVNFACGLMKIGSLISVAVSSNQLYQAITRAQATMENPSKAMSGQGDTSAINEGMNWLMTEKTTTVTNTDHIKIDTSKGETTGVEEMTVTAAPIQANGLQTMLAEAPAESRTTRLYGLESSLNATVRALQFSGNTFRTCAGLQAGAALVSIGVTIASFGTATLAQVAFDFVFGVATSVAASVIMSFLVPVLAQRLFTNVYETVIGEPAGHEVALGISAANQRVAREGSGMGLADEDSLTAYLEVNDEVLAMEAANDRLNRSPFDITSKNTFLGSIAYSVLPIALNNSTSTISSVKTLTRLTSTSIASLNNNVSAKSTNKSYLSQTGKCDTLAEIGAVGDIYCNPIVVSDISTADIAPNDHNYITALCGDIDFEDKNAECDGEAKNAQLNCDENGDCIIKEGGDLAKYITYCAGRNSPFGVVDANIMGALETGNVVLNSIPLIGDGIDLYNASKNEENMAWANGQKCVTNTKKNPDWKTFKYYQRYIEDQRILEQMGVYEVSKNPVTAYQEKYEAEHPLDNSPSGYLSRISGITKDDAELVIAMAEYYNFIENYDPSNRIAMNGDTTSYKTGEQIVSDLETSKLHFQPSQNQDAPHNDAILAQHYIIYADIRNRSYATS